MANGYRPGAYFEQFLARLPQIYQARQNLQLQRDRFEYAKEQDYKDDMYRQQVVQTNEERNRLAREQFTQKKLENTQDEAYRTQYIENAKATQRFNEFNQNVSALKDSPAALQAYIKQSPMMKNNPQLLAQYEADIERDENLNSEANRLWGLDPMGMVFESRKFLNMDGVSAAQAKLARDALNEGINRLTMTNQEFATTEAYFEYATLHDKLSNPDKWFVQDTPLPQKEAMMTEWGDRMSELRKEGKAELEKGFGLYPSVDMEDEEIKNVLLDFTEVDTEEGMELQKNLGPLFEETTTIAEGEQVGGTTPKTAGFTMSPIVKPGGKWKADVAVLEDEAGKNQLIEEYSKTGEATYGPLQAIASEGSVVMPTSRKTFEAVDAGVNILEDAYNTMSKMTSPGYIFDTFGKLGEKAGSPAKWDKEYKESSKKLKKTVKDMYNLYLRLDPSKGEFKKRPQAYKKLRNRLAFQLARLKNLASENPEAWGDGTTIDPRQMPKWSKSPLGGDPEILSILQQIEL